MTLSEEMKIVVRTSMLAGVVLAIDALETAKRDPQNAGSASIRATRQVAIDLIKSVADEKLAKEPAQ